MQKVFIVAAKRTPVGTFMGGLSALKAPELGSVAIKATYESVNLDPSKIDEVILGNVLQAGEGQNPARQACLGADIPISVPNTLVNKVCASGIKSTMLGALSIQTGYNNIVMAGGFESMSNAPFYLPNYRKGQKFGNAKVLDAIVFDGLTDAYQGVLMGVCAEKTAKDLGITREQQDEFAINSYEKTLAAVKAGKFDNEIVEVSLPKNKTLASDEEPNGFRKDKMSSLRPVFSKTGTVTAANASKLNDGAAGILLMSESAMKAEGLTPLAEIIAFDDAEVDPVDFNIAPADAANKALKRAGLKISDIDFFEFNEAFSVTGLANSKILDLKPKKVNVNGGAVAIGHPLGMSGARIIMSLMTVLEQEKGTLGLAGICNGGGGASAIIVKRV